MKKMILLFSHKLSENQIQTAQKEFNIKKFLYLPKELQKIWSNIDPDIENLNLEAIKDFVKSISNKNDLVLIQGDVGACYTMVNFCKNLGLISVYATTKRVANEYKEGDKIVKKSIFEFRRFRKYV